MKKLVWLVSYPKSGNTWFRMLMANYFNNSEKPIPLDKIESTPLSSSAIEFEEEMALNPFELTMEEVDNYRPAFYRNLANSVLGENFFKKTHDAFTYNTNGEPIFPADISFGAVYFVRNPLDICVSYANYCATKVEKMIMFILNKKARVEGNKCGQLGQKLLSWDEHYKSWNEQDSIPIHPVRYEDMLQKPVETFGSIVKFLNLEYDEERLSRSIINSDFKLLRQMEKEQGFIERPRHCESFFWKGTIGNYRSYLSEDQIQLIVNNFREVMLKLNYIDNKGNLTI